MAMRTSRILQLILIGMAVALLAACGSQTGGKSSGSKAAGSVDDDDKGSDAKKNSDDDGDEKLGRDDLTLPDGEDAGSVASEDGKGDTSFEGDRNPDEVDTRLLKPEELREKTRAIFGSDWMVEVQNPTEDNPDGTATMNGFDAFAGNLNGIDYDSVNEYSEVGSAIYISTHEKFCQALTSEAFADPASRATFFMEASETDTLASNRAGVESNLKAVSIKMFGRDLNGYGQAWGEILDLYADLEGASAADRGNRHPLSLTVEAMCFTTAFVHRI